MGELLRRGEVLADQPQPNNLDVGAKAIQSLERADSVESDAVRNLREEWESGSWDNYGDVYDNIDQILPWQDLVELSHTVRECILESEVDGFEILDDISREFYQEHEEIIESDMLSTAVQRYLKAELYGDLEPAMQFYIPYQLEKALDEIRRGLELSRYRYDGEEDETYRDAVRQKIPGISLYYIHLYSDAIADGKLVPDPGPLLAPPRDEAVFVLNQDVIHQYGVMAGGAYPLVDDYLDIEPYLMAVLGKNEEAVTALQSALAEEGYTHVKVYLQDDFAKNPEKIRAEIASSYEAYCAKQSAEMQQEFEISRAYREYMANQVFDQVDQSAIAATVAPFVEKIDTNLWNKLEKQRATDMEAADEATLKYLADILGLQDEMKLKYYNDINISWSAQLGHGNREVRLNLARNRSDTDALSSIAHEMFHEYQYAEADRLESVYNSDYYMYENWAELPRSYLYKYNRRNYIEADKDYSGYTNQLIEREARAFEIAIQNKRYRDMTRDSRAWREKMSAKNEPRESSQGLGQKILRWLNRGRK